LDAQNAKAGSNIPTAPVFNISLGEGVIDLFRPRAVDPPAAPIPAAPPTLTKMLFNPACNLGPDMPIFQFCEHFGLQRALREKLEENGYDFARNLRFISLEDLTQMGFKFGEKAALQDAVERWSVPRAL
jgi:hypothetical protein